MNRVVFLDIDGVLNTPEDYAKWCAADPQTLGPSDKAELLFAPRLVDRLNRITDLTGAAIVVSSSWRHYYHVGAPGGQSFADLCDLFRRVGITAKIIGPTPTAEHRRWVAIESWLNEHDAFGHLNIAILDDDIPPLEWQWKRYHVHCRAFPGGLTQANEDHAISLLNEGA